MMRMLDGITLLIPEKADMERDAVVRAWETGGGSDLRIGRFWSPHEVDRQRVRLYGNDTFCLVLAQKLGLELGSPPNDLLLTMDPVWLKRELHGSTLERAAHGSLPRFIKPLVPKQFRARLPQAQGPA